MRWSGGAGLGNDGGCPAGRPGSSLVHFDGARADALSEVVELDVGVVREEGHGDGGVDDAARDHVGGEALAERVVMVAGVPDGNLVRLPCLDGPDGDGGGGDHGDVAAAAGARVLGDGEGMKLDDARGELAVLVRRGRGVLVPPATREGIVERPMLHVALAALHDGAADARIPCLAEGAGVGLGKVEVGLRDAEAAVDAVEAELAVAFLEAEGMGGRDLAAGGGVEPLVHAPEVGMAEVEAEAVDEPGDEGELLGGANGAADADGVVGGGHAPCVDVFEGLGEVEVFAGIVEDDAEAGAGEAREVPWGEARGGVDEVGFEGGVIPPVGRDGRGTAWHGWRVPASGDGFKRRGVGGDATGRENRAGLKRGSPRAARAVQDCEDMAGPTTGQKGSETSVAARDVVVRNRQGIHARPSAAFVKLAAQFRCEVTLEKDGESINGKSIMGLLMLAAGPGSRIRIVCDGEDALKAAESLAGLVEGGFGEV